ncbi:hypothetical protein [Caulobacter segnis]
MHRLFKRKPDPQALMGLIGFWFVAPHLPMVAGLLTEAALASVACQHRIVTATALALTVVSLLLSLPGGALVRAHLKLTPLTGRALLIPPMIGVGLISSSAIAARMHAGRVSADWGGPFGDYAVFLIVWATLVSWQLKPLWDHALEAWETRRADFTPEFPRFNPVSRWMSRRIIADHQAKAWIERRKARLTRDERAQFTAWARRRDKRAGLQRQTTIFPPALVYSFAAVLVIVAVSRAYHTIWAA